MALSVGGSLEQISKDETLSDQLAAMSAHADQLSQRNDELTRKLTEYMAKLDATTAEIDRLKARLAKAEAVCELANERNFETYSDLWPALAAWREARP